MFTWLIVSEGLHHHHGEGEEKQSDRIPEPESREQYACACVCIFPAFCSIRGVHLLDLGGASSDPVCCLWKRSYVLLTKALGTNQGANQDYLWTWASEQQILDLRRGRKRMEEPGEALLTVLLVVVPGELHWEELTAFGDAYRSIVSCSHLLSLCCVKHYGQKQLGEKGALTDL